MPGSPQGEQECLFPERDLTLQLPSMKLSESMGNHDSKIVDADGVD
jgi:hypothetical protein